MSEGDCVQAATVNRRAKYTRHSNRYVELFIGRGVAAFIADIIRSSGSWDGKRRIPHVEFGAGKGTGTASGSCQWQRQMTYYTAPGQAVLLMVGTRDIINKAERDF
jgi:hypothetical protein